MEGKQLVTITGISGFVGAQVCLHFLKDGNYRVRGTVRSISNPEKMEPLKLAFGELFDQLELKEADLLDEASMLAALEGSDYIVHTASPFPIAKPKHENELINPAVNGTMAVVKAAHQNKCKKIVITSSMAAVIDRADKKSKVPFTPEDWSVPEGQSAYSKSKTLAEKAAWDYQASLPEEERFDIVVINPGFILGPNLNKAFFSSGDVISKIMFGKLPGMPKIQFPIVDVREVALAHLNAVKFEHVKNKRYLLVGKGLWFKEIGTIIHKKYGNDYKKVTKKEIPKALGWALKFVNSEMAAIWPMWGKTFEADNSATTADLNVNFRDPEESVLDMCEALIQTGYIADQRAAVQIEEEKKEEEKE